MGRKSGTNLRIWTDGGQAIGYATECSVEITMEVTQVLHKDTTGNWTNNDPSTQSWSMTTSGFVSDDDTINGNSRRDIAWLQSQITNRTLLFLQWSDGVSGSSTLEGYAYLTSLSQSGTVGETATYNASFTGDGALVAGTET